ncbi:hypothetical protein BHM03_00049240 [Ensete ventricosum]|nr:hypothetical protein BHM03_00049240 [Ensete ventricosum]
MEHPKHEMDGGSAGSVAAAGLVDALSHAPGQLFQPTGVDVPEHHLQRLVPDLKSGHQLSELERPAPAANLYRKKGLRADSTQRWTGTSCGGSPPADRTVMRASEQKARPGVRRRDLRWSDRRLSAATSAATGAAEHRLPPLVTLDS